MSKSFPQRSSKTFRTPPPNAENTPQSSCVLCNELDSDEMVQCDKCDGWQHFQCVGVNKEIENVQWMCEKCILAEKSVNLSSYGVPTAAVSIKSKTSSKKRAHLELQLLNEKMKLAAQYLAEKQRIMEQCLSSDSDDIEDGDEKLNERNEIGCGRTADWISKQIPNVSSDMLKTMDSITYEPVIAKVIVKNSENPTVQQSSVPALSTNNMMQHQGQQMYSTNVSQMHPSTIPYVPANTIYQMNPHLSTSMPVATSSNANYLHQRQPPERIF